MQIFCPFPSVHIRKRSTALESRKTEGERERREKETEKETETDRGGEGGEKTDTQAVSRSAGPDSATRQAPLSVARIQEWVAFPFSRESS